MATPLNQHGQPGPAFNLSLRMRRSIDELLGLCKGVILDGEVSETEAIALHQWVQTHPDAANEWPADVLARRLDQIFEDAIVTRQERNDLLLLLEEITGGDPEEVALGNRSTTLPLDDPPPPVAFMGRSFCFTGKFFYGARRACEREITERGGGCHKSVRLDTDYMVIGLLGSRDWLHSSFGTKIQKAMEYNRRGRGCAIISEKHWASFL